MDTSKTYIKMCEKATEIQSQWSPSGGDWYIHDYRGTTKTSREFEKQIWGDSDKTWQNIEILCYRPSESKDVVISTDGTESRCVAVADLVREHSIWLPRQDQLQEMLEEPKRLTPYIADISYSGKGTFVIHNTLSALCRESYLSRFDSYEQLWLAFVMREKYGKSWNGEDWIKV